MRRRHKSSVSNRPNRAGRLLLGAAIFPALALAACQSSAAPIAFVSDRDGNEEIYAIRASDGKETNLTNSPRREFDPRVSPDGKAIAFRTMEGGNTAIEVMRTDGEGRGALVAGPIEYTGHRWAPNSNRLAYIAIDAGTPVPYLVSSGGGVSTLLTQVPGDDIGDWSPAGDSIVFSVKSGPQMGLYVRNPDGVNEFRRTQTPDHSAVWSPDGKRIAFISDRDGNPEIYLVDAAGDQETRVTSTPAPEYGLSWSPSSKELVFVSERDGNAEIYILNVVDLAQTRLTYNEARDDQPDWSPSGKQIAFASYLDGDAEIFVMNEDGSGQRRLTNNSANDTSPSW